MKKAERNCSGASGSLAFLASFFGLQVPVSQNRRSLSRSPAVLGFLFQFTRNMNRYFTKTQLFGLFEIWHLKKRPRNKERTPHLSHCSPWSCCWSWWSVWSCEGRPSRSPSWRTNCPQSAGDTRRPDPPDTPAPSRHRWRRGGPWEERGISTPTLYIILRFSVSFLVSLNNKRNRNCNLSWSYPLLTALTPSTTFISLYCFIWRCMFGKCFFRAFSV